MCRCMCAYKYSSPTLFYSFATCLLYVYSIHDSYSILFTFFLYFLNFLRDKKSFLVFKYVLSSFSLHFYPSIHPSIHLNFLHFFLNSLNQSFLSSGPWLFLSLSLSVWERPVDERVSGGHSTPLRLAPAKALLCAECRSLPAVTQRPAPPAASSLRSLSPLKGEREWREGM